MRTKEIREDVAVPLSKEFEDLSKYFLAVHKEELAFLDENSLLASVYSFDGPLMSSFFHANASLFKPLKTACLPSSASFVPMEISPLVLDGHGTLDLRTCVCSVEITTKGDLHTLESLLLKAIPFRTDQCKAVLAPFCGLSNKDFNAVRSLLQKLPCTLLDLSQNDFTTAVQSQVVSLLEDFPQLEFLDLTFCPILSGKNAGNFFAPFSRISNPMGTPKGFPLNLIWIPEDLLEEQDAWKDLVPPHLVVHVKEAHDKYLKRRSNLRDGLSNQ